MYVHVHAEAGGLIIQHVLIMHSLLSILLRAMYMYSFCHFVADCFHVLITSVFLSLCSVQEKERYSKAHKAFTFNIHGFESSVGPVKVLFLLSPHFCSSDCVHVTKGCKGLMWIERVNTMCLYTSICRLELTVALVWSCVQITFEYQIHLGLQRFLNGYTMKALTFASYVESYADLIRQSTYECTM